MPGGVAKEGQLNIYKQVSKIFGHARFRNGQEEVIVVRFDDHIFETFIDIFLCSFLSSKPVYFHRGLGKELKNASSIRGAFAAGHPRRDSRFNKAPISPVSTSSFWTPLSERHEHVIHLET